MQQHDWFGDWKPGETLTAAGAAALCAQAQDKRRAVADYPLDKVMALLGRMRERWMDPNYEPRKLCEARLPEITGFSAPMVRKGLEELCWTLDPELLEKKLDTELRGRARREGLGPYRWEPLGVVLHVLAGNVFVGAAGSLVEGLITRNVNILKMSSSETLFLPQLVRTLRECDADGIVSRALAVVDYSSSQKDVIDELKKSVDGIVVWGGEQAVRAYRDGLPARSRLIVFGPKLSVAVVTQQGLGRRSVEAWASLLAREISIWDQNACTAPQACYVEGRKNAEALVEALPAALAAVAAQLPPGRVESDNAVEIQKLRSVAAVAEARGEGLLRPSPRGLDWTVLLDEDPALEPSPLHRTLRVIPVESAGELALQLEALRGYVQTVGLAAGVSEQTELASRFSGEGVLRVVELGRMGEGEIDDPHDGRYDLPQYHHLALTRGAFPDDWEPASRLSAGERRRLIDSRLRRLIARARKAPFYAERLKGLEIDTIEDLPRIPMLTREQMDANMPPKGAGLQTGPWRGGYVTRSGGSTGEPKFSVYDKADWDELVAHAAGLFAALGLRDTDRLANLMLAGDLYGSFVSFDHINHAVGAANFCFAGSSTPETFAKVWRQFDLNAAQGIPSTLIPFLRRAKAIEPALTLEKVIYAGAPLSPTDREWLRSELKVARIASVIGANDGGQLGFQCDRLSGALHHAVDDFNYLEVVDERGRPLPDGETGLLLITSLLKYAFPLIRYALGDQGRIVSRACACGRPARVFEYLGRADDILSVGVMNVSYGDLSRALTELPLTSLQVAVRSGEAGESLVLRAETERATPELSRLVEQAVVSSIEKIKKGLEDRSLAGLKVELFKPGEMPRNRRTGKIAALVDERT